MTPPRRTTRNGQEGAQREGGTEGRRRGREGSGSHCVFNLSCSITPSKEALNVTRKGLTPHTNPCRATAPRVSGAPISSTAHHRRFPVEEARAAPRALNLPPTLNRCFPCLLLTVAFSLTVHHAHPPPAEPAPAGGRVVAAGCQRAAAPTFTSPRAPSCRARGGRRGREIYGMLIEGASTRPRGARGGACILYRASLLRLGCGDRRRGECAEG